MKKLLTLICVIFISAIVLTASAEVITKEIAQQTADIFLSLDSEWHGATDAQVRMVEKDGIPAYYIVEYSEGGWAIVSAQSSSSPIIGYNTTGQYATPGAMRELLDFNARIITARAKDLGNIEHAGWQRARQRRATAESIITSTPDIAPLIKIDLDQSEPFNKYCPTIDGKNTLVGCVAVGMTQAIMVQGYPAKPIGSHTYICENTGIHSIDYDAEPAYDWNAINNSKETGNYDEVARLLYHAGVSVDMIYGLGASGSQTDYVAQALIRNFGYDKRIVHTSARHPDSNKWLELIVNELAHGRAVVYGATSVEGGHCWNIDGWKQSTQMIHCNWGWSGYGNGYFSLDNLVDSYQDISFLYNHRAVFGIATPSTAPYDILLHSTQYAIDTEAGTPLSYVEVLSADNTATYSYELFGPNGTQSPYQISNNKLTSTERVTDSDKFEYVRIKATNITTGISYEKEFNIQIVSANVHKLLGSYKAFANSPINKNSDEEWDITIYADK
ncbi:MAG: C10 family peptidase, partial [Bacteroidales bacterium]|nr:C10 family peptidase [Bacteroidales bacterium]